CMQGSQLPYNF
nr:immunoglobulin light chain junction region [Macaca mulatta]